MRYNLSELLPGSKNLTALISSPEISICHGGSDRELPVGTI